MDEQKLQDTFTFQAEGKEVTIVMYAGVLNKLMEAIGGVSGLDEVPLNTEKQGKLVQTLLTKFDTKGDPCGEYASAFTLPLETHQDLLDWGFQHCVNFIQKTAVKMAKTVEKGLQKLEKDSQPSVTG